MSVDGVVDLQHGLAIAEMQPCRSKQIHHGVPFIDAANVFHNSCRVVKKDVVDSPSDVIVNKVFHRLEDGPLLRQGIEPR